MSRSVRQVFEKLFKVIITTPPGEESKAGITMDGHHTEGRNREEGLGSLRVPPTPLPTLTHLPAQ